MNIAYKLIILIFFKFAFVYIWAFPTVVQDGTMNDKYMKSKENIAKYFVRLRRQDPVVQPDWTAHDISSIFTDHNVRVTDVKLEETEAIREMIQDTIDNGTYAVDLDESDFSEGESDPQSELVSESVAEPNPEIELKPILEPKFEPGPTYETTSTPTSKSPSRKLKSKDVKNNYTENPLLSWFKKAFGCPWGKPCGKAEQ